MLKFAAAVSAGTKLLTGTRSTHKTSQCHLQAGNRQSGALGWRRLGQLWEQGSGVPRGSGRAPALGEKEGEARNQRQGPALPASSWSRSRAARLPGWCTDLVASPELTVEHPNSLQLRPREYRPLPWSAGTKIAHSYQQNTSPITLKPTDGI